MTKRELIEALAEVEDDALILLRLQPHVKWEITSLDAIKRGWYTQTGTFTYVEGNDLEAWVLE